MAITHFRATEISYQAAESKPTFRTVEPLAIYSIDEKWIVVAWCRLRKDHRSFRLDRIKHFKILEEKFEDRKFNLGEYFSACEEAEYP